MNSLMVWSASSAARLIAFASLAPIRICNGTCGAFTGFGGFAALGAAGGSVLMGCAARGCASRLGLGDRLAFGIGRFVAGSVGDEGFSYLSMLGQDCGGLSGNERVRL